MKKQEVEKPTKFERVFEDEEGKSIWKYDLNKNGKLDSDDFKILRGEKDKCDSTCKESVNPTDMITDPQDRQSYLGHKKMEQSHINQYKKTSSPIKKGHHKDMIDQHSSAASEILDK